MSFVACLYKNPVQDYSKDLVVKRNLPRPMYCYHYLVIWPLSLNGICTSQKKTKHECEAWVQWLFSLLSFVRSATDPSLQEEHKN
jgi:hypothetical protein